MNKTLFQILAVFLFFGIGFILGRMTFTSFPAPIKETAYPSSCDSSVEGQNVTYEKGYQAALDYAKGKLSSLYPMFRPEPVRKIENAVIKSIEGSKIILEFDASILDFLAEGKITKSALLSESSILERRSQKPYSTIADETSAYHVASKDYFSLLNQSPDVSLLPPAPMRPLPYTATAISIPELKVGDIVMVKSVSDVQNSDPFDVELLAVEDLSIDAAAMEPQPNDSDDTAATSDQPTSIADPASVNL